MDEADQVRARAIYAGRVQGVGFRYTTVRVASAFAVTGYVMNLADGTVAVVAEGRRGDVEAFLEAVADRMRGYTRAPAIAWAAATGEFEGFGVRFAW